MFNNNLKVVELTVTKDNPYNEIVPEGYVKIIYRDNCLFPWRFRSTKIYQSGDKIELTSGRYMMSTIKVNQEIEIFKLIDVEVRNSIKTKSRCIMVIVRANYTDATTVACKVHKNYSYNDPGFCNEIDEIIGSITYRINNAIRDLTDSNIDKIKSLIEHSIKLIANKYALANNSIEFTYFD